VSPKITDEDISAKLLPSIIISTLTRTPKKLVLYIKATKPAKKTAAAT
jgi:hypothetical protein